MRGYHAPDRPFCRFGGDVTRRAEKINAMGRPIVPALTCHPPDPRIVCAPNPHGATAPDPVRTTDLFVTPAYAQAAGGAGSAFTSFVPLILIFAIMYFLLIRPQQKKVKEHQAMVAALRRGDQVVTQGGVIGKVVKVKDDGEVEVEIADGVKVRIVQSTIATVISKTEPAS